MIKAEQNRVMDGMEIVGYIIEMRFKSSHGRDSWQLQHNKKIYKEYKTAVEALDRFGSNIWEHRLRTVYANIIPYTPNKPTPPSYPS